MEERRKKQMLKTMKEGDELATVKQLWWINKFCRDHALEYSLPLSKYHASMLISMLKQTEVAYVNKELLLEIQAHIQKHVMEHNNVGVS